MQIATDASILGMLISEKRMKETADDRTQEWQRQVSKGDCFRKVAPDGLEIYGEVLNDYGTDDMENFRLCRCYSLTCPEGEIGSVHVSTIGSLVNRKTFQSVKRKLVKGWKLSLRRLKSEGYI
jgi:hypothetical protein